MSPDGQSVDCPKGGGVSSVLLDLGSGDDVAAVSADVTLPVVFDGGAGNDGLFGGGGLDVFDGGSGDDNIISRDGRAEQVDCGSGHDTAISDDGDTRSSCEEIEGDADGDGVRRPADCDDTNPGIRPACPTRPDDRVDQDCSGTDATNLDVDGDGSPRPQDCNDGDPAIRPGAREVAGNGGRRELRHPDRALPGDQRPGGQPVARGRLAHGQRHAQGQGLPQGHADRDALLRPGLPVPEGHPAGQRSRQTVNLHRSLGSRALRRGARVELRFTRAGRIGRVLRYRIGVARRAERRLPLPAAGQEGPGLLTSRVA